MQEAIAGFVHPVFEYGLHLRDRLEAGEALNFAQEQTALKEMLSAPDQDDGSRPSASEETPRPNDSSIDLMRFALAAWLDELFVYYSPWGHKWADHKLETALFRSDNAGWKFWREAQQAETQADLDALEVFYLCVLLGFRGERRDEPEKVELWLAAVKTRLRACKQEPWTPPPAIEPSTHVPPLDGRQRLRRMVFVGGMSLIVLIPFVVFFAARGS
jgi:type VI secretion system protein ImpK